jgi:putative ABC transport system permease protein
MNSGWELIRLSLRAILAHRLRSVLSMLGIGIGVTSVILLTSIGEGARLYIVSQFTQFGTNLLAIHPGRAETVGIPGAIGGTTHKLTIDDAEVLQRIPGVEKVVPMAFGTAEVEARGRSRSVFVYGVTPDVPEVWQWGVRVGSFWPPGDPRRSVQQAVLGQKLKTELFGSANALGDFVHIAGTRFRVVGLMEPKGQFLGFDLDDSAYIPVASAMRIFNMDELVEIDLTFSNARLFEDVESEIRRVLTERHGGREDFSVTSQAAMLEVFDNIMNIITMAVGAIGGISLLVGAIGILTMMWIAVGERRNEIGLIRSIGATQRQVQLVFLVEAATLATLGGLAGVAVGAGLCAVLRVAVPGLPVHTPLVFVLLAVTVSLTIGLAAGVTPARRAARLDPIEALRAE